jgi:integrase
LLEREGLPRITFHGLRRTIATLLKGENAHPKDVAALLGHASTKMTLDTYTQMLPGVQAALVQKIEKLFWGENESD